ncbi:MAG: hypothetical protein KO463_05670 [Candidatus Methanofastidiosa archaeon]|nr:hypothetical protein [Candidatus Methanofastidiosa archaeon]
MIEYLLCSGAEHLKDSFERAGKSVRLSEKNYDGKRFFMNSDVYSRLPVEEMSGKDVVVVQSATLSTAGGERYTTQDRVFEVLEFLSILRTPQRVEQTGHKQYVAHDLAPPASVSVVYTCMPCAKQDHACLTGEVNSAKLALDLTLSLCDKVYIIDPHPPLSLPWFGALVEQGRVAVLTMVPAVLRAAQEALPEAVILGPDEGSAARLGIQSFSKSRISSVASTISGSFDVKGCDVLIVDDMVLSGGTLRKTREKLVELGARSIGAALTHAMPVYGGEENLTKIREAFGGRVFVTNTVHSSAFADMAIDCVPAIIGAVEGP